MFLLIDRRTTATRRRKRKRGKALTISNIRNHVRNDNTRLGHMSQAWSPQLERRPLYLEAEETLPQYSGQFPPRFFCREASRRTEWTICILSQGGATHSRSRRAQSKGCVTVLAAAEVPGSPGPLPPFASSQSLPPPSPRPASEALTTPPPFFLCAPMVQTQDPCFRAQAPRRPLLLPNFR